MDRLTAWGLALSAALTLASPALADTAEATFEGDGWHAHACVDAGVVRSERVAELKAQAAIVRAREADRVYGHEAHEEVAGEGRNHLRVSSYSGGRMAPVAITDRWNDQDAATGREVTCVRVLEQSRHR